MQDEVLKEINKIFSTLQEKPWQTHSPALLSAAQGKLASYLSNVIALCGEAQYEYELRELNASQFEAEQFLINRRDLGMTIDESKYRARLDSGARQMETIEARKRWQDLKGIVEAMRNLSVACSTSLKFYESERINANKQGN